MKYYKYQLPGKLNTSGSLFADNSSEAREKVSEMHGETENLRLPIGTKIWEEMLSGSAKKPIEEIIDKSMEAHRRYRRRRRWGGHHSKSKSKSSSSSSESDVTPYT